MKEIKAILQPARLFAVLSALREIPEMPGVTVSDLRAFPRGHAQLRSPSHGIDAMDSYEAVKLECVVMDELAPAAIDAIARAARTGNPGDGKIYVYDVADAIRIQTGKRGEEAI
ncbi:MAG: P-II family nitrogen regulator [Thermoanaerobaculia bacterium]